MVLMAKSGRCGHFVADNLRAACARWSAYGRKVAEATAMIGRTGGDSFLFAVVIGCHETLALLDSGFFSQFLLQKNCSCGESSASHAPLSDGCINVRPRGSWVMCEVFKCKGSECQFVMSTVGAVQATVSRRKKVKIIFSRTILHFSGSVEISKL